MAFKKEKGIKVLGTLVNPQNCKKSAFKTILEMGGMKEYPVLGVTCMVPYERG